MNAAPPAPEAERTLLTRVRRMASLIPTKWLLTGAGAALLAMTAAFGGLREVPPPPTPTVKLGDTYSGSDLDITVQRVELRTERGNAHVFPDEEKGQRVLAVLVEVTNTFPTPRLATALSNRSPVVDGISVKGVKGKPEVSYTDNSEGVVWLQPNVPVPLVVAWLVEGEQLHDGEQITLTMPTSTHRVGTNVQRGVDMWDDVKVGATLTTTVQEISGGEDTAP